MIKLIVLDVDGCLTDGKIIYDTDGKESKNFNVKDGLAIASAVKLGLHIAIITGRQSSIVKKRANELKIEHLYQGIKDKLSVLRKLADSLNIEFDEIAAIGDDLNDLEMLQAVGLSYTPNNGVKDIQNIVSTVLNKEGGDGAVREMLEEIFEKNGQYEAFLALYS